MNIKPNVLIIISDQLRRNALSIYGDPNIQTPNIDKLSENGVCFTNACSTYPLCIPFRYTLMTGQYAHQCMIPALGWRMSPSERTMADEFNDAGYQTAYIGKWHLYGGQININGYSAIEENNKPVPQLYQGRWQYWRGFELRNGPYDTNYYIDDDPTPHKIDGYQTDGLTDLTMDFISNKRDNSKQFCCVLSVEPPHPPFIAPPELEKKWLEQDIELPPNFMLPAEDGEVIPNRGASSCDTSAVDKVLSDRKKYYAMLENLDINVGKITDCLKENGLFDDTIIVFTADHGESGGSHSLVDKQYPYEESIGIPLIISGPGVTENRQLDAPVCTEDLFPTIMGLAGITPKNSCHGNNLSPQIKSGTYQSERPGILLQFVWEPRPGADFYTQIWRGFRSKQYKYTVLGDIKNGLKPWQFFDLENDPYELNNLIDHGEYQEQIKQHSQWMREQMIEIQDDEFRLLPT